MVGFQAEIDELLKTPVTEVYEPLPYSGQGLHCTITPELGDPSFVHTQAFNAAAENLATKLLLRQTGGFHSDDGIRHDSISWLTLSGVEVTDPRLGDIAFFLGGTARRYVTLTAQQQDPNDRKIYLPGRSNQRAYLLGAGVILSAMEVVSYSRKEASTYLSIVFHQKTAPGRDVPVYYTTAIPARPPIAKGKERSISLIDAETIPELNAVAI